ncbi:HNH endonuclease [Enterococcus faecalis]
MPFSKGGSDELDNLVCACRKCNRQKKDKTLEEFERWRKKHE